MALIVEDGSAKTDATSLASVEDATRFQEENNTIGRWNDADTPEIEAALRQASRYVTIGFIYQGEKTNPDQALAMPRVGLIDEDGRPVEANIIHWRVIEAVSLLALYALDGPLIDPKPGKQSRSAGGSSETFVQAHNRRNFREANLLLRPFLRSSLVGPSVDLVRA